MRDTYAGSEWESQEPEVSEVQIPGRGQVWLQGVHEKSGKAEAQMWLFLKSSQTHHIARTPPFRNEEPGAGEEVTWLRRVSE